LKIGQHFKVRGNNPEASFSGHGVHPTKVAANNNTNIFKAIIQLNCVSQHLQLQTGTFYWNKVLLPACLADSNSNNDKCQQYISVINML